VAEAVATSPPSESALTTRYHVVVPAASGGVMTTDSPPATVPEGGAMSGVGTRGAQSPSPGTTTDLTGRMTPATVVLRVQVKICVTVAGRTPRLTRSAHPLRVNSRKLGGAPVMEPLIQNSLSMAEVASRRKEMSTSTLQSAARLPPFSISMLVKAGVRRADDAPAGDCDTMVNGHNWADATATTAATRKRSMPA
jgi:hypothetical protein